MLESKPIIGTEILTFTEDVGEGEKMWVACWRRRDVVAQGKTEKEAFERLLHSIAMQCIFDAEDERSLCGEPPRAELVAAWEKSHAMCHPG